MFLIYEFFDGENEHEYVIDRVSDEAVQILYQVSLTTLEEFNDAEFTLYLLEDNSENMEPVFSIYYDDGKIQEKTCFANKSCNCWQKFCIKEKIPAKADKFCLDQIKSIFKD